MTAPRTVGLQTLGDVRVLEFGMNLAAPGASSLLSDLGADVIKVESPGGDATRGFAPQVDDISVMFAAMNRNKRYLGLDLSKPESRDVLEPLFRWADVVIQNIRPGKAAGLGIAADQCHAINPRIIHVSIGAFYPAEQTRPGYDLLVQAETGMMSLTGPADGPPSRLPGSLIDHVVGLWAAFGITAALHGPRDKVVLEISMADVAVSLIGDRVASYLASGVIPTRMGSAIGTAAPLQAFATAKGDIVIGAISDSLYRRLCEVIDPSMLELTELSTAGGRTANRDLLNSRIEQALASADADTWFDRLDAAGVPAARVRYLDSAAERHRTMSRTGVVSVDELDGINLVANPLGTNNSVRRPKSLGGDSRSILTDVAGFSDEAVAKLVSSGIVAVTDE